MHYCFRVIAMSLLLYHDVRDTANIADTVSGDENHFITTPRYIPMMA
jgi:hypothetical protein